MVLERRGSYETQSAAAAAIGPKIVSISERPWAQFGEISAIVVPKNRPSVVSRAGIRSVTSLNTASCSGIQAP